MLIVAAAVRVEVGNMFPLDVGKLHPPPFSPWQLRSNSRSVRPSGADASKSANEIKTCLHLSHHYARQRESSESSGGRNHYLPCYWLILTSPVMHKRRVMRVHLVKAGILRPCASSGENAPVPPKSPRSQYVNRPIRAGGTGKS